MANYIVLGTWNTKREELDFLCEEIRRRSHRPIPLDLSTKKATATRNIAITFEADHGIDETAFLGGGGGVVGVVPVGQGVEGGGVFAADDGGLGMDPGLEGVHGRGGFALNGAGAGGFQCIQSVGGDLLFGCHDDSLLTKWKRLHGWWAGRRDFLLDFTIPRGKGI